MPPAAQLGASPARPEEATEVGRLFEEYSDRIHGYCLRYLGCRAEAEDAVQTTFLYAHRALQRGIVPESEYVWLHAIAKNVCRWQKRTLARRGRLSSDVELDELPALYGADGEARELLMGLEEALASIPEEQRRALVLREWHGLSSREIASRLGMSAPATYQLLTRARHSLARALSAAPRRPALSFDFGALLLKLKALLAGGAAKAFATTAVVAGVAVGGVAVERAVDAEPARPFAPAPVPGPEIVRDEGAAGVGRAQTASAGAPSRDGVGTTISSVPASSEGARDVVPKDVPVTPPASSGGAGDLPTTPEVKPPGSSNAPLSPDPPPPPSPPLDTPSVDLPVPESELPPLPPLPRLAPGPASPTDDLPLPSDPPAVPPLELPTLPL